ncbi:MAG: CAP domain-containing protein [Bacteroidetes bacterium]|nr:CAP domain-containing protein [Bacteroidota bacterium]
MWPAVVFLYLLPLLFASDKGGQYLSEITLFQKDSYFKQKVYEDHTWKSFDTLKEPNRVVDPAHYDLHLMNAAFFFATNKLREQKNVATLKFSAELRNAAVVHTHQMVAKNFFEHVNPKTAALKMPPVRLKLFGVNSTVNGENIDMNSFPVPLKVSYLQVAEVLVKDLYNSPPHRKVMLDKNLLYLGCGAIFETKDENNARSIRATQDFSGDY